MKFEVIEPDSFTEAVSILQQDQNIRIMAGGTDLLVKIKRGLLKTAGLLSLRKIDCLKAIGFVPGKGLSIGSLVTHSQVAADPIVNEKYAALALACQAVGSPQIRNLGTIAGNIANASPAADTAPALLALAAEVVVQGPVGVRRIALTDFFLGPGQTVLDKSEIITEIFVPEPSAETKSTYIKIGRRKALEVAICGVALVAEYQESLWVNPKLALGAVAPTPILALKSSAVLAGQNWSSAIEDRVALVALTECNPIDDQRASAEYRQSMVKVVVRRVIKQLESLKEVGKDD